jgi:TRAP-type C4-dicarboxylate transport system permease small subunit
MKGLEHTIALLARVNALTLGGCRVLTMVLVAAIAVVVCIGVYWRYVLNDALAWTEETAKFLMVWMVFTGTPIALARGGLAAVDTLPASLPPRGRQSLFGLIFLVVLLFLAVLVVQGYAFALNARVQVTPTTGVSMMWVFAAMPLGGLVMFLITLQLLLESVLGVFRPERGVSLSEDQQAAMSPE